MIYFFLTQGTVGLEVGRAGEGEWQLRRPALLGFQVPRSGTDRLRRNTGDCRVSAPLLIGHPVTYLSIPPALIKATDGVFILYTKTPRVMHWYMESKPTVWVWSPCFSLAPYYELLLRIISIYLCRAAKETQRWKTDLYSMGESEGWDDLREQCWNRYIYHI